MWRHQRWSVALPPWTQGSSAAITSDETSSASWKTKWKLGPKLIKHCKPFILGSYGYWDCRRRMNRNINTRIDTVGGILIHCKIQRILLNPMNFSYFFEILRSKCSRRVFHHFCRDWGWKGKYSWPLDQTGIILFLKISIILKKFHILFSIIFNIFYYFSFFIIIKNSNFHFNDF